MLLFYVFGFIWFSESLHVAVYLIEHKRDRFKLEFGRLQTQWLFVTYIVKYDCNEVPAQIIV